MPQLRWTLLCLGVLFIILLAWIERRRQQRQGFTEHTGEKEHGAETTSGPVFREPALTLPEMRARDPGPPQDLPVVEIEDDTLNARRVEVGEPLVDPPTLSLPVMDSGPPAVRGRAMEPTLSDIDSVELARPDVFARSAAEFEVPRLDTPAPKRSAAKGPESRAFGVPVESAGPSRAAGDFRQSDQGTVAQVDRPPVDIEERAFNEAVFGHPARAATSRKGGAALSGTSANTPESGSAARPAQLQEAGDSSQAPQIPAKTSAPGFTAADVTPVADPIVDWPPDDQRRVIALRLVASAPDRLAGRALRLALASEGFVLGKFQIFHKPDESGRAVLSAADLSKPGTFDLATMDLQRYGGVSLFAVLPGPRAPLRTFDDLLATARSLNERLQGALQDERGGPLTPTRIATLRESLGAVTTS